MIKQDTVLIAQPIAERNVEAGISLAENAGSIVRGLNELSYPVIGYEAETLPVTLPEYTSSTAEHGQYLDGVTTKLAEVIQMSFGQIRKYLSPFGKAVVSRINMATDYDTGANGSIYKNIDIKYRKLDLAFFNSHFYPETANESSFDYSAVPLSALRFPGTFVDFDASKLHDLLAKVDNDDVRDVIDEFCPGSAFSMFVIEGEWAKVFANYGDTIDARDIGSSCPCKLFSLFLLFNYLSVSDEILDGITNITEQDYRNWVKRVTQVLTVALIAIKQKYKIMANTPFSFIKNTVHIIEGSKPSQLKGNLTVTVTDQAIIEFNNAPGDAAISDAIIGRLCFLNGLAGNIALPNKTANLIEGKEIFGQITKQYAESIVSHLRSKLTVIVKEAVEGEINLFQKNNPEFAELYQRMESPAEYCRLSNKLSAEILSFTNSFVHACVENQVSVTDFVMGSSIVPALGKALGLDFAADVLSESTIKNAAALSEVSQRENLTEAVARVLTKFVVNFK